MAIYMNIFYVYIIKEHIAAADFCILLYPHLNDWLCNWNVNCYGRSHLALWYVGCRNLSFQASRQYIDNSTVFEIHA